ncbi:enolase [Candidatus Poribacteria bacterium]|jgi:L-alanine-DL-glutamate epimerase-like enolase superfamily enzyme|nr:enolase [Candidatus Poribacteria bacterium]MBT5533215.1 enolase [Candidatus Poribacteria bacterium]MBT5709534.1 enolase [Candidatus Poribacteria bacterium]MBT7804268.1 enolase [Candidatus Poribacteria bacterium]
MKIVDVRVETFRTKSRIVRDSEGHTHPGPEHDSTGSLLRIVTDDGAEGYTFGANGRVIDGLVKPLLIGEDPFYRERIWQMLKERQRLHLGSLSDRVLTSVDMALWDLAGRALGQPVHKLLGAFRDKVPAYGSTMCGDDLEGGLDTPEAYADFAVKCVERGYPAFKLHTWQPPYDGAPSWKRDVEACRAVREAVGPDIDLMLDPFHYYSREEALYLGRALEELDYYWIEEPMDEHSTSSYVWLADQLDLPVVGPETAEGKMQTRAEWIVRGASDISRGGVGDLGGITPLVKTAHLCEAHGVKMEVHGGGPGNLHVLCAMGIPGHYYERGLLHPFVDYEQPSPWLNELTDPMDDEGFVHVSQEPGLGWNINWDYIETHSIR